MRTFLMALAFSSAFVALFWLAMIATGRRPEIRAFPISKGYIWRRLPMLAALGVLTIAAFVLLLIEAFLAPT